ncbi:unnamed protein product [Orchesella dallaii]|uniref:39S ribosomal protein L1, mitochondrial n=1 Tax=Orchesella dallaii TaxID=48710 RepID=A0ABP1QWQ6_9HEXA
MLGSYLFRSVCMEVLTKIPSQPSFAKQLITPIGSRGLFAIAWKRQNCLDGDDLLKVTPKTVIQHQVSREYAARKGTRTRKAAKKVKKVEEKRVFVFKQHRKLANLPYVKQRPFDDSDHQAAVDDVYFHKMFRMKCYPFDVAVQNLRETHHPTMYNVPNAPLYLRINLDMKYPNRATKCMDGWRSVVEMKNPFLLDGMVRPSVLAFCMEDVDYIDNVRKAGGADMAGGKELIKSIQTGDLNPDEFEYVVAHPSIITDLTAIRGLIKRKFPNVRNRTISVDLVAETQRLKSGIKIHVETSDREPDFAFIETPIGTLDMDGLADNFKSILRDTLPRRVANKDPRDFVISCVLKTPGNGFEEFKIELDGLLEEIISTKPS